MDDPLQDGNRAKVLFVEGHYQVSFLQVANSNSKKRGVVLDVNTWRGQCRELVCRMMDSPDSEPFRQPVDLFEYPVPWNNNHINYNATDVRKHLM